MSERRSEFRCVAPTHAKRTRYGEVPRFPEGLHELAQRTYAWLVPNGSWGESNSGLVVAREEALLIDTLWDVAHTRRMLEAMAPFHAQSPIRQVVNTHADGDHFWGNQLVADAEIVTSLASQREMSKHHPRTMLLFERLGRLLSKLPSSRTKQAGHWFQAMCAPYDFADVSHTPATRNFSGELTLRVGEREVHLIEVGPAHTSGDLMVHVPDTRTLFTGDVLFVGSTPPMWAGPVENWLTALDRILDLDVDVIVPGHGPPASREDVLAVKDYWCFLVEEARKRFDAGMTARDAAYGILSSRGFRERPYGDWDSPERIMLNIYMLYRHFRGKSRPPATLAIVAIMYRQALLAHALPSASPAAMRRRDARAE